MPTNLNAKFGIGFEGKAVGNTTQTALTAVLNRQAVLTSLTGSGKQVYEQWNTPIVLGATATTVLNLLSGLVNPLGETIAGASMAFSMVQAVGIQLATAAPTAGVEAFGGTVGSQFQGPLGVTCSVAVKPGQCVGFNVPANMTGWTVNSTAKNIQLRNLATTAATVGVIVLGTV